MQDVNNMTDEQISVKYNDYLKYLKSIYPDKKRGELIEGMRHGTYDYRSFYNKLREPAPNISYAISPKPTVTCPYCQSTDTKKISGTSRWVSTGLFGLASSKVGKQWHCNKCKSDF